MFVYLFQKKRQLLKKAEELPLRDVLLGGCEVDAPDLSPEECSPSAGLQFLHIILVHLVCDMTFMLRVV